MPIIEYTLAPGAADVRVVIHLPAAYVREWIDALGGAPGEDYVTIMVDCVKTKQGDET